MSLNSDGNNVGPNDMSCAITSSGYLEAYLTLANLTWNELIQADKSMEWIDQEVAFNGLSIQVRAKS